MKLITILGPTAVGKTKLAVNLAAKLNGEVISADSRQVYHGMDIGTGKDLDDFKLGNQLVKHHLIDIKSAGEKYDVFHFQRDFYKVYNDINQRSRQAILCGGTGLYIQAALDTKSMVFVPENKALREILETENQDKLNERLKELNDKLHNKTDLTDRKRTIRAIEIAEYERSHPETAQVSPVKEYVILGLRMERERLRSRIEDRMEARFEEGMIEEVQSLLDSGVSEDILNYYGLEYRYILLYLRKEITLETMKKKLLQSIRQFAKKQMTWYRRMEKMGENIHWLEAEDGLEYNLQKALKLVHHAN